MTTSDLSIQTAPRDVEGLTNLQRSTVYRLSYQLQAFACDEDEQAFGGCSPAEKAQLIKVALDQYDAGVTVTHFKVPRREPQPGAPMNPMQPIAAAVQPPPATAPVAMPPPPQMQIPGMQPVAAMPPQLPPNQLPPGQLTRVQMPQTQQVAPQQGAPPMQGMPPQQGMPPVPVQQAPQPMSQTALPPMNQAMPTQQAVQQAMQPVVPTMAAPAPAPNTSATVEALLEKVTAMAKASADVVKLNQRWLAEVQAQQNQIMELVKTSLKLQVGSLSQQYTLDGASLSQSALMNDDVFNAFLSHSSASPGKG